LTNYTHAHALAKNNLVNQQVKHQQMVEEIDPFRNRMSELKPAGSVPEYYTYFKQKQSILIRKHKNPWIAASSDPDKDPTQIDNFNREMEVLSTTQKATFQDLMRPIAAYANTSID